MPFGDGANTMYFSKSGRYLVTSGNKSAHLNIWDLEKGGKKIASLDIYFENKKGHKRLWGRSGKFSYKFNDEGGVFLPDDSALLLPKARDYEPHDGFSSLYVDMANPANMYPTLPKEVHLYRGCFSPDGKYFVVRGVNRLKGPRDRGEGAILKLYRTRDWSLVADVKYGIVSDVIAFTPDGKYVVDYEVDLQESSTPEIIKKDPEKYEYPEIRFWSVPDLRLVKTIDNVSKGSASTTPYMAISPDGKFVAVGARTDGIYYFNEEDRARYRKNAQKNYGLTNIYSIDTGELIHGLDIVLGYLYFTHDSKYLIVTSGQDHMAVRIFSTRDWQLKEQVGFKDSHWSLDSAFNSEKNLLAFSNGNIVYIWKVVEK